MVESNLTLERLKELFSYEPSVGEFVRRSACPGRRCHAGAVAGARNHKGHIYITIDGRKYAAHRLAWLYMCGSWPDGVIDHVNGVKDDNRISNLRDVDGCVNQQNRRAANNSSRTGVLGVYKAKNRYVSVISINGKAKRLGSFLTIDEAHRAYIEAKRVNHDGCTI